MSAPVLDVEGLTVRLPKGADRVNAVENVSFSLAPGEIVCVVGESGSGKSVTAHAIMGLLPPNQLGVTGGQASLLFTIQRRPGIGVRELAALERMSAPGMSKYVGRLEAAGLIVREPSDVDRRRVGLRVSPEGERVLRSVKSRRTAWLAAGLTRLSETELEAVDAAIEPLQELIDE